MNKGRFRDRCKRHIESIIAEFNMEKNVPPQGNWIPRGQWEISIVQANFLLSVESEMPLWDCVGFDPAHIGRILRMGQREECPKQWNAVGQIARRTSKLLVSFLSQDRLRLCILYVYDTRKKETTLFTVDYGSRTSLIVFSSRRSRQCAFQYVFSLVTLNNSPFIAYILQIYWYSSKD